MFEFRGGNKTDKIPEADNDIAAALYTPEAIKEDQAREEAMIQETLTRGEWEERMREKAEMRRANEINESEAEIAREDDDSEKDKPGYELYGRFAQYLKSKGSFRKKLRK